MNLSSIRRRFCVVHTCRFGQLALVLIATVARAAVPEPTLNPIPVRLPMENANRIRFTRISPADGLSQTRVSQIVQDDQGFIWFGTQHGLNRYDGYKFKVFLNDPQQPKGIGCNYIWALSKDRTGKLWIGCEGGLDEFDPATGQFKHHPLKRSLKDSPGPLTNIAEDRTGRLWIASATGLWRFDPRTGEIDRYVHDPADPLSLPTNDILWTGEDREGTLWVGTAQNLNAFDPSSGKVTFRIPVREGGVARFYEDRFGVFWVRAAGGLAVLDRKGNLLTSYTFYDDSGHTGAITGSMDMTEDIAGNLWIGTGVGLLRFDRNRQRFVHYRSNPEDPESLAEDKVICLHADREGNIWVGLHSKGPNHFNPEQTPFEQFRHEPWNRNSLATDFVSAIYEDGEGALWIANDEELVRIDRKTGRWRTFNIGPKKLPYIITIIGDGGDGLWLGTAGRGLTHFHWKTGQFQNYAHDPKNSTSLSDDRVHRLIIDHAGTLWAATEDGLDRFDASTGTFKTYRGGTQYYLFIAEDQNGIFWLGTTIGLQRFDPSTERFTQVQKSANGVPPAGDGLAGQVPRSVLPGSEAEPDGATGVLVDGTRGLWLSTYHGLERFDRATNIFANYGERAGLAGSAVACILPDAKGNIWMSTNQGISSFDPVSKTFRNYSEADGLPGNDLTGWETCSKGPDGEMFFGGFSGAVAFYPERLRDSSYHPPVVLTDLQVAGKKVDVRAGPLLQKSIAYTNRLVLSHEQSSLSLSFAALSYASPATNRYRYKLDGADQTWHEVGSDGRVVSYTALPPGTYTFRAQGATSRGPWSEPGIKLQLQILPPFWATWWFRAALALLLLSAVWWAHQLRLGQLARQFDLVLEERISERTRIARELHDTLLQSFQGLMLRFQAVNELLSEGRAKEHLERTLQRADQAIAEGRGAVYDLRSSTTVANELAEAVKAVANELATADSPPFRLVVEGRARDLHPIIRDELYRITREALRNAFTHARANHIETEIIYGEREFRLRIRDDGNGISPEIVAEGRAGHYGLGGMRERAQRIGAKLLIWSGFEKGTEIGLNIPAAIAYGKSQRRLGRSSFRGKEGLEQ